MTLETIENDNGHGDINEIPESEGSAEEITAVVKKLENISRGQSPLTLTRQDMGLLHSMLRSTADKYQELSHFRETFFDDDQMALDHVSAYFEAEELGMDTNFNIAFMFALCSINRKGVINNLMGMITDTIQMGKHATTNKGKQQNGTNSRSPLNG